MQNENRVSIEIQEDVARIRMDDGKVNAMSTAMLRDIGAAFDEAQKAGALVVLEGRAGIFSAGFDLGTFQRGAAETREMLRAGVDLIERLLTFPLPVLSVCNGHAYPMGAFLMLSSDVRLAGEGPWQIGMNEVAIGLTLPHFVVELGRHRLTRPGYVGIATATMFAPDEARRVGYLDRVFAQDALAAAVEQEVQRLRALNMEAFAGTKARLNERVVQAVRAAGDAELSDPS